MLTWLRTVLIASVRRFADDVALDVLGPDTVERLAGEERRDVVPQVRCDGEPVRLAPALQLEPLAELGAGVLHRDALGARRRARRVDFAQPPQHLLGLGLRQPIGTPLGPNVPDLSLHAAAIGPVPRADPRAADHPQRSGAIGSASHQATAHTRAERFSVYRSCSILT